MHANCRCDVATADAMLKLWRERYPGFGVTLEKLRALPMLVWEDVYVEIKRRFQ